MIIGEVKGKVMEKVHKVPKNGGKDKFQLLLFQKGNETLVNLTVDLDTYNKVKEGQEITIPAKIDYYVFDNNHGQYALQTS